MWAELERRTEGLFESDINKQVAVLNERQIYGVERVIKNHAVNQTQAAKIASMYRTSFKELVEKLVAEEKMPAPIQENKKLLYTLKHMEVILNAVETPRWSDTHKTCHVINVQCQKGGTGKSTWTVSEAVALALTPERPRVLVIDLDPQGSLRRTLAPQVELEENILTAVDIMLGDDEPDGLYSQFRETYSHEDILYASIQETHIPNLNILTAFTEDERFSEIAWNNKNESGEFKHLDYLKTKIIDVVRNDYDIILIDTGPQINPLVWSAQVACNGMIVPLTPENLDWASGSRFLHKLTKQRKSLPNEGENIKWLKVALTNVDRPKHSKVAAQVRKDMGAFMFANEIVNSDAFDTASANYCTVLDIKQVEKLCSDTELKRAQSSVKAMATEVMAHLDIIEHELEEETHV